MSAQFVVGAFNAHWGIGRFGAARGRPYDVRAVVRGLDADVVVVPESFRDPATGVGVLDALGDDGYTVESVHFMRLRAHKGPDDVRPAGDWELAVVSRLPVLSRREIWVPRAFRDAVGPRPMLAITVEVGTTPVEILGVHTSSKVWYGAPVRHLRALARQLPAPNGPAVVAGDCNLWGPGVIALLRGWRRAVLGRTYPAHRPHSQIDHVLVNDHLDVLSSAVLPATESDHRPIRAQLALR